MVELKEFCEEYGLKPERFTNFFKNYPKAKLHKHNHKAYLDETILFSRLEFKKKVQRESHIYYYALEQEGLSGSRLERVLQEKFNISKSSWHTFLVYDLFASIPEITTDVKVQRLNWLFYRFCKWHFRGVSVKELERRLYD